MGPETPTHATCCRRHLGSDNVFKTSSPTRVVHRTICPCLTYSSGMISSTYIRCRPRLRNRIRLPLLVLFTKVTHETSDHAQSF